MIDIHRTLDLNDPEAENFLANLQGNILKPHGRAHITLLQLHFQPGDDSISAARSWLAEFAEQPEDPEKDPLHVTSTKQQLIDARAHRLNPEVQRLFCMLAISADGYKRLAGYEKYHYDLPAEAIPADVGFRLGMKNSLGWSNITDKWEESYGLHAMVILAHDDPVQLQKYQTQITKSLEPFCIVTYEQGDRVMPKDSDRFYEHFGFADGISNPLFIDEDIEKYQNDIGAGLALRWNPATPLHQVLVEEPQKHDDSSRTYGSYMVFYKLEQNLDTFRQITDEQRRTQLFGRKPDGTPLIEVEGQGLNNFNYLKDPDGKQVELKAHIRKMNERLEQSVRIARRGITYDYGEEGRGILFLSYQADIQNQFECLLENAETDALLSHVNENSLVKDIFGQYFYVPSLPALKELATLRNDQRLRFRRAFRALLTRDEKLVDFGKKWQEDRLQAAVSVGITPNDLATLYAVFHVGDKQAMEKIKQGRRILDEKIARLTALPPKTSDTSSLRQETPKDDVEKLRRALQLLLEPEKLKSFIETWASDPEGALRLVDLDVMDANLFYTLLSEKGVNLDWPLWF